MFVQLILWISGSGHRQNQAAPRAAEGVESSYMRSGNTWYHRGYFVWNDTTWFTWYCNYTALRGIPIAKQKNGIGFPGFLSKKSLDWDATIQRPKSHKHGQRVICRLRWMVLPLTRMQTLRCHGPSEDHISKSSKVYRGPCCFCCASLWMFLLVSCSPWGNPRPLAWQLWTFWSTMLDWPLGCPVRLRNLLSSVVFSILLSNPTNGNAHRLSVVIVVMWVVVFPVIAVPVLLLVLQVVVLLVLEQPVLAVELAVVLAVVLPVVWPVVHIFYLFLWCKRHRENSSNVHYHC